MAQASIIATSAFSADPGKLRLRQLALGGVTLGAVALFCGLVALPAIATGMVIAGSERDRRLGRPRRLAARALGLLAVTIGVLAIFFFGGISTVTLAGLAIVPLVTFAERELSDESRLLRVRGRLFLLGLAAVTFAIGAVVLLAYLPRPS